MLKMRTYDEIEEFINYASRDEWKNYIEKFIEWLENLLKEYGIQA